ncbi:protein kinase domain-containing protein [Sorangium sp. So ce854]|uniref:serine/threonine-protein kinase n=1 Tax=Sorangium sp. So ce854 TaxID=3133322 RepID=UPI003F637BD1
MQSPSPPAAPPPGTLVCGKYRLLRQIGEGAMGVVWAAHNEATSREVALKLLVRPDPELRARLLREARACGAVSHRNIVDIYDADEAENGSPFLVMPLLSGETLSSLLKRKRKLEVPEAARIARDIARGLSAAHERGIIHRDLKPSNIFLHTEAGESDYVVKILDFGVSKFITGPQQMRTATGILIGSPAYMSPEQVRAQSDIDTRADLWALGVVMFEMLTSRRPIQGKAHELLRHVLQGDIPAVSQLVWQIDPGLDALVTRCLQRDREQRPRSAAEVAAALEPFVTSSAPPRVPSSPGFTLSAPSGVPSSPSSPGFTPSAPSRVPSSPGSSPDLRHEAPPHLGRGSWGGAASGPAPATTTPLPASLAPLQAPHAHASTPGSPPRGAGASPAPASPAGRGAAAAHQKPMSSNPLLGEYGTIKLTAEHAAAHRASLASSPAAAVAQAPAPKPAVSFGGTVPLDPLPPFGGAAPLDPPSSPRRSRPEVARPLVAWIAMAVLAAVLLVGIGMAAGYLLLRAGVESEGGRGEGRATFDGVLSLALGNEASRAAVLRLEQPC